MTLITWDDSLSVNVKEIDEQHKKLIEIINELHTAMKDGKGRDVLGKILQDMTDYTVFHFETEEKYFKKFNYMYAGAHIAEHKTFVDKVTEFKTQFEEGSALITTELMHFLVQWLKNHIKGSDQKYTECFNENGLS